MAESIEVEFQVKAGENDAALLRLQSARIAPERAVSMLLDLPRSVLFDANEGMLVSAAKGSIVVPEPIKSFADDFVGGLSHREFEMLKSAEMKKDEKLSQLTRLVLSFGKVLDGALGAFKTREHSLGSKISSLLLGSGSWELAQAKNGGAREDLVELRLDSHGVLSVSSHGKHFCEFILAEKSRRNHESWPFSPWTHANMAGEKVEVWCQVDLAMGAIAANRLANSEWVHAWMGKGAGDIARLAGSLDLSLDEMRARLWMDAASALSARRGSALLELAGWNPAVEPESMREGLRLPMELGLSIGVNEGMRLMLSDNQYKEEFGSNTLKELGKKSGLGVARALEAALAEDGATIKNRERLVGALSRLQAEQIEVELADLLPQATRRNSL